MGKEQNKEYYNNIYSTSITYKKSPKKMVKYYYCWEKCAKYIKENNIKLIIDIGCGPGHFAQVINDINKNVDFLYFGIDFSEEAIKMSQNKFIDNKKFTFICSDALKFDYKKIYKNYNISDVLFTSFEFMEHVSFDRELLNKLPKDYKYIFSIPSYDSPGHFIYFESLKEVHDRYDKYIKYNKDIEITPFKIHTYYIDSTIL